MACCWRTGVWLLLAVLAAGCARKDGRDTSGVKPADLRKVRFQTDWFPQAEHGGFYQALAKGFYREAGLEVEILPGGPGAGINAKVSKGDVDFGMHRSDSVMMFAASGLPLVMVAATFQHDPQALMVHAESQVKTLRDLEGRTVAANISMAWIPYIKKKYGIEFNLTPNSYGLTGFWADKNAIQQCMATNEPYLAQQRGVPVRTLLLADFGYDAYHTVICRRELVRNEPALVRAFVAASIRGWRDYLAVDPAPAEKLILERNAQTTHEFLQFSRAEMIRRAFVSGDRAKGEDIGQLSLSRLAAEMQVLVDLKVLDHPVAIATVATTEFLQ